MQENVKKKQKNLMKRRRRKQYGLGVDPKLVWALLQDQPCRHGWSVVLANDVSFNDFFNLAQARVEFQRGMVAKYKIPIFISYPCKHKSNIKIHFSTKKLNTIFNFKVFFLSLKFKFIYFSKFNNEMTIWLVLQYAVGWFNFFLIKKDF